QEQAIDLHFDASRDLMVLGERAKSIDHAQRAEALAEALGDERRLAWALVLVASRAWNWGDSGRGLELPRRAVVLARRLGDVSLQASVTYRLAAIGHSTGNYRQSAEALSRLVEAPESDRLYGRLTDTMISNVAFQTAKGVPSSAVLRDWTSTD